MVVQTDLHLCCSHMAKNGFSHDVAHFIFSDTIDAVKQSAALTLLRLLRSSPDVIQMGEWTSRIIHLLNDQHMVRN